MRAAERLGAIAAFDVDKIENPVELVRQLTDGGRGADSVIEAVGRAITWEWALQMVRKGGTVNLFGGCPTGTEVKIDPAALHYSEITIKSTFHHTPQFMREAMDTIARGEIRSSDFITGEVTLEGLPKVFQDMKNRNGELKTAVIP
jgi:L-iditol 2-dehydrogenase